MYHKIVLAGGSGFLGKALIDHYKDKTEKIVVLTRRQQLGSGIIAYVPWDGKSLGNWCNELESSDLVINLCGENVNCRYTEAARKEIFTSRIEPTEILGTAIENCSQPHIGWIHQQDFVRITEWLLQQEEQSGVFNCTAPGAVTNREFMTQLRQSLGIPFGIQSPKWLLEFGAMIIGTETELVSKSRWVIPKRLQDAGFQFYYPTAQAAIDELTSSRI